MTSTRIPNRNLDILRAFAVGCVLFDHVLERIYGSRDALHQLGRVGVLLFFVHTSLVLMASLERHRESAGRFFVRRAFRIYPLAIAVVLAIALRPPAGVLPRSTETAGLTARTLVANLTLTQNLVGTDYVIPPLWTLPIELQMYALLPLCFVVARKGYRRVLALLSGAVVAGLAVWLLGRPAWGAVATFGPCFVAGVLAYAILRRGEPPTFPAWCWPVLLLGLIAAFSITPIFSIRVPEAGWSLCLVVGLLIPIFADAREDWLARIAFSVAKYSYGIYLLHAPAMSLVFALLREAAPVVKWGTFTMLIVVLPVAAYHFIEAPGIALGRRILGRDWSRWRRGKVDEISSTSSATP